MKRIVILSTAYYPFVGGAEISVKEITDRLGNDFHFDLITARLDRNLPVYEKLGNIDVYRIGWGKPFCDKLLLPFLGAIKLFSIKRKLPKGESFFCFWGIMITFGTGAGYIFNFLQRLIGNKKVPMIVTLQEGDSEDHLQFRWGGLLSLSWILALRYADFVTALSSFLMYRAERFHWAGPSQIVPNGVNLKIFSKKISVSLRKEMLEAFGKKEGDIFLVTSSRLTSKNAIDDIITSLAYLSPHISLLIIGRGEEKIRLQAQARTMGLAERVLFVGFVKQEDLPKYFSISDIFVRPSRSEGFGNSFIEAMASHLPVIATPVGGIVDFVSDKQTGFFCSPNNPKSLAESVKFILENKELTETIVTNAYTMVLSRFNWDDIAQKMKNEVFNQIK